MAHSIYRNLFTCCLVLLISATTLRAAEGWETDWEKAKAQAQAEKKDLLVDFTGSDWCGWCKRLVKEVFSHDEFNAFATQKFVLVELDFPSKIEQSEELKAQNEALKEKYGVRGFPTIYLMDSQGRPYGRTGYRKGGPEGYNAHLAELIETREARDAGFEAAEKLEGIEQAAKLVEVLQGLDAGLVPHYTDVLDAIAKADPDDSTGFVKQQKKEAAMRAFKSDIRGPIREGKKDEVMEKVAAFIAEQKLEGAEKQEILFLQVNLYPPRTLENVIAADSLMDAIIAVDDSTDVSERCRNIKEQIVKMRDKFEEQAKAADEEAAEAPAEAAPAPAE